MRLYNSLRRTVEVLPEGLQTWYACGPTVYDHCHLGHARTYVCHDVLRRAMGRLRPSRRVVYAMGVTDVDDKILARAREVKEDPLILARRYEASFFEDLRALNVLAPDIRLRVSEHIEDVVSYIEGIEERGMAYAAEDGVYFDVGAFETDASHVYGKLGRAPSQAEAMAASPIADSRGKRDPRDFALWKLRKDGEQASVAWASPWGDGRPGWHIECSAMTHAAFGESLDLHSGGIDLAFPHHCNEIAQCEAHNGRDGWVKHWLHCGHLHIEGRKMSKSLKNFVSVQEYLNSGGRSIKENADAFRLFCLQQRYRSDATFSDARMEEARHVQGRLRRALDTCVRYVTNDRRAMSSARSVHDSNLLRHVSDASEAFAGHMADDLDTPRALTCMLHLAEDAEERASRAEATASAVGAAADALAGALGGWCGLQLAEAWNPRMEEASGARSTTEGDDQLIETLLSFRREVRAAAVRHMRTGGDGKAAMGEMLEACDRLRDEALPEHGVHAKDINLEHTSWWRESSDAG